MEWQLVRAGGFVRRLHGRVLSLRKKTTLTQLNPFIEPHGGSIQMSRVTMPVLVRLLLCAALFGVLGASATPSQESASTPESHLPTTNSLSGYIIAVG